MKRNEGESFEDYKIRRKVDLVLSKIALAGKQIKMVSPINRKIRRLNERYKNRG